MPRLLRHGLVDPTVQAVILFLIQREDAHLSAESEKRSGWRPGKTGEAQHRAAAGIDCGEDERA